MRAEGKLGIVKMSGFRYAPGLAVVVAGCAAASQNMIWIRGDGQAMLGDAVLMRRFDHGGA